MKDFFLNKRRAIELGHLDSWSRRGHTWLHPENEGLLRWALEIVLRATGLLERGLRNALAPTIRAVRIEFDSLPHNFDGYRILHLTDIHGDQIEGLAENAARAIAGIEADLCVLTGDYRFHVNGPCRQVYPVMEEILGAVETRDGTVGVLGNHDSIEMVRRLEGMGVRMLMNEGWELRRNAQSIWAAGVDDPHYYGCDNLVGALSKAPEEAFRVLLVHSPELVEEAEEHGVDLYLCGHTHGGQIRLPLVGPLVSNTSAPRKFTRGVWRHGRLQGYTSHGVGASCLPVRFNCPPEIGLIELKSTSGKTIDGVEEECVPAVS